MAARVFECTVPLVHTPTASATSDYVASRECCFRSGIPQVAPIAQTP